MLDATDTKILSIMQSNARICNAELARQLGMAPSGVLERVRKLEARGVIQGYDVRVDPAAVDRELLAFIFVRATEQPGEIVTGDRLAEIPGVLEVHHVAGEDCYLVKVRVAGTGSLGEMLRDQFGAIPTVRTTRSTIVLDSIKESIALPIAEVERLERAS